MNNDLYEVLRLRTMRWLYFGKQESVADLEGKVKELEGFCTEALDELDAEKAKNAKLRLGGVGK